MKIHIFCQQMVLVVLRSLSMCSGFLSCACGVISLSLWLFLWFLICELVQVLFLSFVFNF